MSELSKHRDHAFHAFQAGVAAAHPETVVRKGLALHADHLGQDAPVHLVAVGKAAVGMARAAMDCLGAARLKSAIAVTNYENVAQIEGCTVLGAAHPVPDKNGAFAAQEVVRHLTQAKAGEVVLVLVSGGSSALLPAPIEGLTLSDKIAVNQLLLASGLEIGAMNIVRQALSALKGGGMLVHAGPARVVSLILSDVLGDDLSLVGSGPSVAPAGSVSDARRILQDHDLWSAVPASVQSALTRPDGAFGHSAPAFLVGGNAMSLKAMAQHIGADVFEAPLVGDVEEAAQKVVTAARQMRAGDVLAFGGETTVKLCGDGQGGRNQELAVRVARASKQAGVSGPWVFLSGGTDGRDGPTDAAGAVVDHTSLKRAEAAGAAVEDLLANNDCYQLLERSGDLLKIPSTGTNVADLQLLMRL